jgi:hypothetical protein
MYLPESKAFDGKSVVTKFKCNRERMYDESMVNCGEEVACKYAVCVMK